MPLTPYHMGPSSAIGIIFKKAFDIPALLFSSVILDIEPFAVMVFYLDHPLHGFFHSFTLGTPIAMIAAAAVYFAYGYIKPVMALFRLEQKSSFLVILWSSFFGVYSHVVLDSFLYSDIKPFYPSAFNPFYRKFSLGDVHLFCVFCFAAALIVYLAGIVFRKIKSPGSNGS